MRRILWILPLFFLIGCQISEYTSELPEIDVPLLTTPTATPVPTETPSPTIEATPEPYAQDGFVAFAERVKAARIVDRPPLINDYMARLPMHPLVGDGRAVFLWRGVAQSVGLVGDMNSWDVARAWSLERFPDTDLWYLQVELDPETRLDYEFLIDGQREILDPLNPVTRIRKVGPRSEMAMPTYERPAELAAVANTAAGTVTQETLESAVLGQTRTVFVYQPAVPPVGEAYPVVYVQDGTDYLTVINAPVLLDRLIALGEIRPLIVVFVPPIDRLTEYDRNGAYTQFVADELRPFVAEKYPLTADASQTAVLGSGLGGLAALDIAFNRPELFGLAAAHSADITADNEALSRRLRVQATLPVKLHVAVGVYEDNVNGRDILGANRRLAEVLEDRGYEYQYTERPDGHSWGLWEVQFGQALRYLFAGGEG